MCQKCGFGSRALHTSTVCTNHRIAVATRKCNGRPQTLLIALDLKLSNARRQSRGPFMVGAQGTSSRVAELRSGWADIGNRPLPARQQTRTPTEGARTTSPRRVRSSPSAPPPLLRRSGQRWSYLCRAEYRSSASGGGITRPLRMSFAVASPIMENLYLRPRGGARGERAEGGEGRDTGVSGAGGGEPPAGRGRGAGGRGLTCAR